VWKVEYLESAPSLPDAPRFLLDSRSDAHVAFPASSTTHLIVQVLGAGPCVLVVKDEKDGELARSAITTSGPRARFRCPVVSPDWPPQPADLRTALADDDPVGVSLVADWARTGEGPWRDLLRCWCDDYANRFFAGKPLEADSERISTRAWDRVCRRALAKYEPAVGGWPRFFTRILTSFRGHPGLPLHDSHPGADPDPADAAAVAEEMDLLLEAVGTVPLDDTEWRVWVLSLMGRPKGEIASCLGLSPAGVSRRICGGHGGRLRGTIVAKLRREIRRLGGKGGDRHDA
jgi:hypothetical protein